MGIKIGEPWGKKLPKNEPPVTSYIMDPEELAKYRAMKPESVRSLIPTIRKRGKQR